MSDHGKIFIASSNAIILDEIDRDHRPWQYDDDKHLICQRCDCRDPQQRRELSKRIFKFACNHSRKYCTSQTRQVLESFNDLRRLERIHRPRSNPLPNIQCQQNDFANLLADIYNSPDVDEQYCKGSLRALLRFTLREL